MRFRTETLAEIEELYRDTCFDSESTPVRRTFRDMSLESEEKALAKEITPLLDKLAADNKVMADDLYNAILDVATDYECGGFVRGFLYARTLLT